MDDILSIQKPRPLCENCSKWALAKSIDKQWFRKQTTFFFGWWVSCKSEFQPNAKHISSIQRRSDSIGTTVSTALCKDRGDTIWHCEMFSFRTLICRLLCSFFGCCVVVALVAAIIFQENICWYFINYTGFSLLSYLLKSAFNSILFLMICHFNWAFEHAHTHTHARVILYFGSTDDKLLVFHIGFYVYFIWNYRR